MQTEVAIPCPLHPKENIQRVNIEFGEEKELYCIECLLHVKDPAKVGTSLTPLNNFIASAAKFYDNKRKKTGKGTDPPVEFIKLLEDQADTLGLLSKHAEDQKKKLQVFFGEIIAETLRIINEKKDEYFQLLDQEVLKYRYFTFFEKQLRKAFPKEDVAGLYPTKEELYEKLGKLGNTTQLLAFVRNIKEDLNEDKILSEQAELTPEENRIFLLKNLSKKIQENKNKFPTTFPW